MAIVTSPLLLLLTPFISAVTMALARIGMTLFQLLLKTLHVRYIQLGDTDSRRLQIYMNNEERAGRAWITSHDIRATGALEPGVGIHMFRLPHWRVFCLLDKYTVEGALSSGGMCAWLFFWRGDVRDFQRELIEATADHTQMMCILEYSETEDRCHEIYTRYLLPPYTPTPEQRTVIDYLMTAYARTGRVSVLIYGKPGTGKTALASLLANAMQAAGKRPDLKILSHCPCDRWPACSGDGPNQPFIVCMNEVDRAFEMAAHPEKGSAAAARNRIDTGAVTLHLDAYGTWLMYAITIMTMNSDPFSPKHADWAFLLREGRFDAIFEFRTPVVAAGACRRIELPRGAGAADAAPTEVPPAPRPRGRSRSRSRR